MWRELASGLQYLVCQDCRAIVLSGQGKSFCAGIDLEAFNSTILGGGGGAGDCPARRRLRLRAMIEELQAAVTALEDCPVPVVAAVHGACVGGGVDLATAADIRLCSADAAFTVKEVDLAIVADMGTLARLPSIVGAGAARELALTARTVGAGEAAALGLVSRPVYADRGALLDGAARLAARLAAKSPLAVAGTKRALLYGRDHPAAADANAWVAAHNAAALESADVGEVFRARAEGRPPAFSKL